MSVAVAARPAPAAELRTSLGLASLSAALIHLMGAVHEGVAATSLAAAAILAGFAAALTFTRSRGVLGPAVAFNAILTLGIPSLFATPAQVIVVGGALALLWGASDRTCSRWSRLAFAVFALAAFTGFGHLGH